MWCPSCNSVNAESSARCRNCGADFRLGAPSHEPEARFLRSGVVSNYEYAGFGRRVAAHLLDVMIVGFATFCVAIAYAILGLPRTPESYSPEQLQRMGALIGYLCSAAYYVGMQCSETQATFGKMALGLFVTDESGNRLTLGRAAMRELLRFLCVLSLGVGYVAAAFSERRQGFHDMVSGSLVLRKRFV